uniref:Uncharacterized protein n=1 Tax=Leuconostoc citreum TaxID=33964 RepID=A0A0A1ITR1_LEUCI|nr:Protein of unknown function [Leuconostoc citreum]
MMWVTKNL